ncbi:glycosyltransferase family 39 protein [Streptacidiphilus sp. 4-A2]|nr:glycosyltransferase family 39 protein [Streptacidiphilus sp. 4-A2]
MLAGGGVLYNTVVDRKPPLLPWLYDLAFHVFGSASLWPLRVLALAAHLTTALLLAAIARKRWGDRAGAAAGVLYLLLSIGLAPPDSQAATFEVFMLPSTAAAFWYAQEGRWGPAGAATAVAALTKQTGGAVLLPLLWLLWRGRGERRRSLPALLFGFGLPVAVIACSTGVRRFFFWVVSGSSGYASPDGAWLDMLERVLGNSAILGAAALGLLVPLARAAGGRRGTRTPTCGSGSGLLARGDHRLPLLRPLLPATAAAAGAAGRGRGRPRRGPLVAGARLLGAGLHGLLCPRLRLAAAVGAARGLGGAGRRQGLHPAGVGTGLGMHPEMYWLADRKPATRYLTAGLLTNFSGGRDGQGVGVDRGVASSWKVFETEMARHLPEVVVDDSAGAPYAPRYIAPIRALLAAHYDRVGQDGTTVIYRLRPGGAPHRQAPRPDRPIRTASAHPDGVGP